MRLGVLDVGSNTVHLLLVDAHWGAHPTPMHSQRWTLKLASLIGPDGALSDGGASSLIESVAEAAQAARDAECEELLGFATSAVRDASNSAEVLDAVTRTTGIRLQVLSGEDEARLTFLAVRRWFGWSAGNLLVLDIGGGSLEIGGGQDEEPTLAVSLPIGAGRMYRERLAGGQNGGPPGAPAVTALREHALRVLAPVTGRIRAAGPFDRVAGSSKTFRTLARLAGAAPTAAGPRIPRFLSVTALRQVTAFISRMAPEDVGALEGVSADRSAQLAAGAAVALAAMTAAGVEEVQICPWALREGVILQRLDQLAFPA
jgi:exopolyphosphatase/guanosine-5'-triphosphate,3'-diphosphate pyrophosphatase